MADATPDPSAPPPPPPDALTNDAALDAWIATAAAHFVNTIEAIAFVPPARPTPGARPRVPRA